MRLLKIACLSALVLALPAAWAADATPVGLWKNIDDVTGQPKALIRISDNQGELQGKIEKLFRKPGTEQNPVCTLCDGANKGQPVIGMMFMWGLKKDGEEFAGGSILDPDNGKVYKSKMSLVEGGKKLKVRGYVGVPMFGRSQTWVRQE
ncbi:DUF2147 domain-containing protein [Massilia glaciei]|uniref:DUF2147 domain-containing protein n=1 Tax=Massilia glaciei TaxID=1524097 RepID=A0A2U2HPB2_9BURK|nr:DUF2147 domain-containing protein [Massilia glaciei]PWF49255.1 DUF2147 domain-containing protein [Massilia glaciei]